jgi:hypothetical protein
MKRKKKANAKRPLIQYGALPYREGRSGLEVLLVTSRETRRWIIPKGWPQSGLPPHRAAANEAFEEAGVVGKIGKKTIGSYWYDKTLESGAAVRCKVRVFPLRVTRQLKKWPEKMSTTSTMEFACASLATRAGDVSAANHSELREAAKTSDVDLRL